MDKLFLRRAILTVVGTTFLASAVAYPVLGGNPTVALDKSIPIANAAEHNFPEQPVAGADEKQGDTEEPLVNVDGDPGPIVTFSSDATALTKAEWEAVAGEDEKKAHWSPDTARNANPAVVARAKAPAMGLDRQRDQFIHIGDKDGKSEILVSHGEQKYILTLAFIPGKGWVLVSSREIADNVKPSGKIITGNVKLDMQKLADLQKLVNYGYQPWRLDPLQVAKYQGQAFGFDRFNDSFEMMPGILMLREHGEASVMVTHGKGRYVINLRQPFGNTKDKIWTIASVKEIKGDADDGTKPNYPVQGTIYNNNLLNDWTWSKGSLPKDMAFTAVIDLNQQRVKDTRFRSDIWDAISSYDHRNNILLLAYLGTMPTGGYDIGIKKVTVTGREVTVQTAFKSPARGAGVTMAITHPFDVVLIPKYKLPLDKEVTFKFVDPNGKLLTSVSATVK